MRLLLVENDSTIGQGIESSLKQAGYRVDWARDCQAADLALENSSYLTMILDISRPESGGQEMLQRVRTRKADLPVLVLTARDQCTPNDAHNDNAEHRANCNEPCCENEYLAHPFEAEELHQRVQALVRRTRGRNESDISCGKLVVDPVNRRVMREGVEILLSPREFAVLLDLVKHRGMARSRVMIEQALYGWNDEIGSNAIEVHVHNLRKKLGPGTIQTIRGLGYLVSKQR